ncbi:hypothetical protein GGD65_006286 [Bradyrhizobium sp. CIR18]|uniref:hypothetical protein n=1 Tax=Bradyrhizobium sp. CIR18 TaxID=2663839 RepID=UPI0016066288|nr:hypothetical protein [Bradyrhizobium sp. CIR18]MBB4365220.1 hypothetical protein [Bradyrhizobium sp. CIR18]
MDAGLAMIARPAKRTAREMQGGIHVTSTGAENAQQFNGCLPQFGQVLRNVRWKVRINPPLLMANGSLL